MTQTMLDGREIPVGLNLEPLPAALAKESAPAKTPSKAAKAPKTKDAAKSTKAPLELKPTAPKAAKKADTSRKAGKVETSLTPAAKAKAQKSLELITADIRKETSNIASAYMRIGYRLWQVREQKPYLAVDVDGKPLKNVYEYCELAFGFKSTSAKNFIAVCEKFSTKDAKGQPTDKIDPAFAMFGYTQLSVMLPMDEDKLKLAKPEMSKREIESLKSDGKDDNEDSPTPTRKVCFAGEINDQTWDRLLDKLDLLRGKRIQITVED